MFHRKKFHMKPIVLTARDAEAVIEMQTSSLSEETLNVIVETFEALADPSRARILYALLRRPLCVRDLAILIGISESGVSRQLRVLRDRRLVKSRREGKMVSYFVDDRHLSIFLREAEEITKAKTS